MTHPVVQRDSESSAQVVMPIRFSQQRSELLAEFDTRLMNRLSENDTDIMDAAAESFCEALPKLFGNEAIAALHRALEAAPMKSARPLTATPTDRPTSPLWRRLQEYIVNPIP